MSPIRGLFRVARKRSQRRAVKLPSGCSRVELDSYFEAVVWGRGDTRGCELLKLAVDLRNPGVIEIIGDPWETQNFLSLAAANLEFLSANLDCPIEIFLCVDDATPQVEAYARARARSTVFVVQSRKVLDCIRNWSWSIGEEIRVLVTIPTTIVDRNLRHAKPDFRRAIELDGFHAFQLRKVLYGRAVMSAAERGLIVEEGAIDEAVSLARAHLLQDELGAGKAGCAAAILRLACERLASGRSTHETPRLYTELCELRDAFFAAPHDPAARENIAAVARDIARVGGAAAGLARLDGAEVRDAVATHLRSKGIWPGLALYVQGEDLVSTIVEEARISRETSERLVSGIRASILPPDPDRPLLWMAISTNDTLGATHFAATLAQLIFGSRSRCIDIDLSLSGPASESIVVEGPVTKGGHRQMAIALYPPGTPAIDRVEPLLCRRPGADPTGPDLGEVLTSWQHPGFVLQVRGLDGVGSALLGDLLRLSRSPLLRSSILIFTNETSDFECGGQWPSRLECLRGRSDLEVIWPETTSTNAL